VKECRFRDDLYYRLTVFPLEVRPLRERRGDIIPLAEHFLATLPERGSGPEKRFTWQAKQFLESCDWPGNVRQLRHSVERACILSQNSPEISPAHLPL
jgi:Nif-specific regulatory protein